MDEHRRPSPQRRLRDLTIATDNVGGDDIVGDEPLTLRVEPWRKLDRAPTAESWLLLTLALQIVHVFVDGDEVSGVVDWSEGGQGDAMYDLATLTLAHEEHLNDVVAGYGGDIEIDVIRAYWSLRSLMEIRWLVEHGYGAPATFPQVAVLNSLSTN